MNVRPTVLLIDDDRKTIDLLAAGVTAAGCDVVGLARNGEEGIRLVERMSPDLVVVDRVMPGLGGASTIEAIKRVRAETKVFGLTSEPADDLRAAGASCVFTKTDVEALFIELARICQEGLPIEKKQATCYGNVTQTSWSRPNQGKHSGGADR